MTYGYNLTPKDLISMGLEPTKASKYYVEQSGWTCFFGDIVEIIPSKYGELKGKLIAKSSTLTEKQKNYIIQNVKHVEYDY